MQQYDHRADICHAVKVIVGSVAAPAPRDSDGMKLLLVTPALTAAPADPVTSTQPRPTAPTILGLIRMMLLDVGLPLLAYYGLHATGVSDYRALLAGTVVAGLRVAFVALRNRTLDGFAGFLMAMFAVGLALSFATGDARFMLAKDSIGTVFAGLIFLGSCVVGRRPMMFYAAQRFSATTSEKRAWWHSMWQTNPAFRRGFRMMSVVWGIGLLTEAAVRIPLIYVLPIHVMVGLSTLLQTAAFALLMTWTVAYGKRMRRLDSARITAGKTYPEGSSHWQSVRNSMS